MGIESFDAPEIVGASFEVPEMLELWEKTSKPQEKCLFIYRMFGDREIHHCYFYAVKVKGLHVFLFI